MRCLGQRRQLGENEGQPSEKVAVAESFVVFLGSLDRQKGRACSAGWQGDLEKKKKIFYERAGLQRKVVEKKRRSMRGDCMEESLYRGNKEQRKGMVACCKLSNICSRGIAQVQLIHILFPPFFIVTPCSLVIFECLFCLF